MLLRLVAVAAVSAAAALARWPNWESAEPFVVDPELHLVVALVGGTAVGLLVLCAVALIGLLMRGRRNTRTRSRFAARRATSRI